MDSWTIIPRYKREGCQIPEPVIYDSDLYKYIDRLKVNPFKNGKTLTIHLCDGLLPRDRQLKLSLTLPYSTNGLQIKPSVVSEYEQIGTSTVCQVSFQKYQHTRQTLDIRCVLDQYVYGDLAELIMSHYASYPHQLVDLLDSQIFKELAKQPIIIREDEEQRQANPTIKRKTSELENLCHLDNMHIQWNKKIFLNGSLVPLEQILNVAGEYTLLLTVLNLREHTDGDYYISYSLDAISCTTCETSEPCASKRTKFN